MIARHAFRDDKWQQEDPSGNDAVVARTHNVARVVEDR